MFDFNCFSFLVFFISAYALFVFESLFLFLEVIKHNYFIFRVSEFQPAVFVGLILLSVISVCTHSGALFPCVLKVMFCVTVSCSFFWNFVYQSNLKPEVKVSSLKKDFSFVFVRFLGEL